MTLTNDEELEALIEEVKRNPDKIIDKSISDDQILKIQKRLNPYGHHIESIESKRVAMLSYTNLEEDYLKRFLMTGMVGFLYRMVKEAEIDESIRSWDERDQEKKKLHKEEISPFSYNKLRGIYDALGQVLPSLKTIEEEENRLSMKKMALDIEDRPLPDGDAARFKSLSRSKGALLYGATYLLIEGGRDAEKRWPLTLSMCEESEDVMKEISRRPIILAPPPERRTMPEETARGMVKGFLDNFFDFNPDIHVKSAHDEAKLRESLNEHGVCKKDPSRPSLSLLSARILTEEPYRSIMESRELYNSINYLLSRRQDEGLISMVRDILDESKIEGHWLELSRLREEHHLAETIPPSETFNRWDYYMEVNMEEIRMIVNAVYDEKPCFDLMFNIYDVFEGTDEEIASKKTDFIRKYGEELLGPCFGVELGKWVFMANFKENRKEIDFMNRHTEVLKRILDRYEEDKKLGKDMMKKRVRKAKEKSMKEVGTDAAVLKEYQDQLHELASLGAERALTEDELREMEALKHNLRQNIEVQDVPDDAIQVNVFKHDTETGVLEKSIIYTEACLPSSETA